MLLPILLLCTEEDDLIDVLREVGDLSADWERLGLSLGLKRSDLKTVQGSRHSDVKGCLSDMLAEWLKHNFDVCNMTQAL